MTRRSSWHRIPPEQHGFQVRLPRELFDQLRALAAAHGRSINREIEAALYSYVAREEERARRR